MSVNLETDAPIGYSAWCEPRRRGPHEPCSSKECACWCHWPGPRRNLLLETARELDVARAELHSVVRDNERMRLLYEIRPPQKNLMAITEALYWFYRMVETGGPDMSDLDAASCEEARAAADDFRAALEESEM